MARTHEARPDRGAHEWVSFEDPGEERTWLVDVTFLLSPWTCIFGAGCQGVLTGPAAALNQGCCSYGAHFSSEEDRRRTEASVELLAPEEWQFGEQGLADGVIAEGPDATTTALVEDACIFLNRPGFPGGAGCAFHLAARRLGRPHLELKPEVCWQLPLRREDLVEDGGHVTTKLGEWDRRHWGPAGSEFHWWCTDAPDAFVGRRPAYQELADELRAMLGPVIADAVFAYLDERASGSTPLPHPALRTRAATRGSRARR